MKVFKVQYADDASFTYTYQLSIFECNNRVLNRNNRLPNVNLPGLDHAQLLASQSSIGCPFFDVKFNASIIEPGCSLFSFNCHVKSM